MSAIGWASFLIGGGGALGWATFIARILWGFRGRWDATNGELRSLQDEMKRSALERSRIEHRLDRHLDWHDRQLPATTIPLSQR
jgi:hypothetical protein